MANVHHNPVKKFALDGSIHDESSIWRLKNEYIRLLTMEMRFSGYVPRLDINPDFTLDYIEEKQHFIFKLSMYGVYVGKKRSEWITGVDEQKIIYTQKTRSNVSSSDLV